MRSRASGVLLPGNMPTPLLQVPLRVGYSTAWVAPSLVSLCFDASAGDRLRECWLRGYSSNIFGVHAAMYLSGLPVQLVAFNSTEIGFLWAS